MKLVLFVCVIALLAACAQKTTAAAPIGREIYPSQSPSPVYSTPSASWSSSYSSPAPPKLYPGTKWTVDEAAQAIKYIAANAVRPALAPLTDRIKLAKCIVPLFAKKYGDFNTWSAKSVYAPHGKPPSNESMFGDVGLVGQCEQKLGIPR